MLRNCINDGANGVTECPIPPNNQKTYNFLAEQYGTTWYELLTSLCLTCIYVLTTYRYHSHFSSQYGNGVVGSIQINGPASLPYDIDLGVFPITDWYYDTADEIQERVNNPATGGAPPPSDNVLFNGTNINPSGPGGTYARVKLTPGKRHLLRLINPSVENHFSVSLVNHQMTVIANDLVPVNSFTTNTLFLGIGQRYDVTIDASQAVGNYWFNVTFSNTGACGTSLNPRPAAIFSYNGAPNALPTIPGATPVESLCHDAYGLTPVITRTAPLTQFTPASNNLPVTFEVDPVLSKVLWKVNSSSMVVRWEKPTLQFVLEGNTSYPRNENLISVPTSNVVSARKYPLLYRKSC